MPSDSQEPGAIWQGSPNSHWNQAADQVPAVDYEEPQSPYSPEQALYPGTPLPAEAAENEVEGSLSEYIDDSPKDDVEPMDAVTTRAELLKQLGHYFTLVLVPLLFGALTCLFVLPQVATGHASLPAYGFWPITLVIVAITVAQSVAVYYAGTDNGMWTLATLGGFFLFLLVGCFASFGLLAGFLLLVALVAISIFLARRCLHPVADGYADVLFAFKKYSRTLQPGFNIILPWETVAAQLNVAETQWICPAQTVQLSRTEDVVLRAIVSYQLLPIDAQLAVTQVNNWEESLRNLFIATLQTTATQFTTDDFLTWPQGLQARHTYQPGGTLEGEFKGGSARRERINSYLFQQMRDKVALWGVQINWVTIRDVELAPHGVMAVDNNAENTFVLPKPAALKAVHAAEPATHQASTHPPASAQHEIQHTNASHVHAAHPQASQHADPETPPAQLKEEILIKVYKEVQDGHITDPQTIRDFAAKFELVAKDPKASQTISFDAARAALNLYEQARKYEEQLVQMYDTSTKPDWRVPPPH